MKYKLVRRLPMAMFFYKGTHSHPVRRTVLVIENNRKYIKGYEVREGNVSREPSEAHIKTFKKTNIATVSKLRRDNKLHNVESNVTTLNRMGIKDLAKVGI